MLRLVKTKKQIDEETSFKNDLSDLRKDIKNLLDDKGITGGNQQKGRTSLNEEILKLKRENEGLKKRS